MVARIETPHAYFGKDNVPNNKKSCRDDYRSKYCFPTFDIPHPAFETIQKRDKKGSYVQKKV